MRMVVTAISLPKVLATSPAGVISTTFHPSFIAVNPGVEYGLADRTTEEFTQIPTSKTHGHIVSVLPFVSIRAHSVTSAVTQNRKGSPSVWITPRHCGGLRRSWGLWQDGFFRTRRYGTGGGGEVISINMGYPLHADSSLSCDRERVSAAAEEKAKTAGPSRTR